MSSTALEVLGQAGDASVLEDARHWKDHEKPRPKAAALVVLKNSGDETERQEAHSKILAMLSSSLPQENIAAAQAITALADVLMMDDLKILLISGDGRVRATAVHAYAGLGQREGRDCADEVANALNDEMELVRVAAVKRLPAVQSESLRVTLLAKALDDHSPAVRRAALSLAAKVLPTTATGMAEAFTGQFHHFRVQALLAAASKNLDQEEKDILLEETIRRHLDTAKQKRYVAARILASDNAQSAIGKVLHEALNEEVRGHVCAAMDLLAEKIPGEAIMQAATALRSQDAKLRAQGLESLQCLSDNVLARGIAELADQPELKLHGHDKNKTALREVLESVRPDSTPWLSECIEAFLGEIQNSGRPGYAV